MTSSATNRIVRLALPLLAVLLFVATPARSVSESAKLGFNPNHQYVQGLMGESLDVLSGNLTLEIPIGPSALPNPRCSRSSLQS